MKNEVKLESDSIDNILNKMNNNYKIMLPAIQRKFVWSEEKILRFIDSILLGYPIGVFLFWELNGAYIKKNKSIYSFYKFINVYNDRDKKINEKIQSYKDTEYIAVLDGQQRLTALNIALNGYIETKKVKNSKKNQEMTKKFLYINLLGKTKKNIDEGELYNEIAFIKEEEIEEYENNNWVKLGDIVTTKKILSQFKKKVKDIDEFSTISENINLVRKHFVENVQKIQYYNIKETDINVMLELFVRVNSGGQVLQKSDLLFSTIISKWDGGREKVDTLIEILNKRNGRKTFNFNSDYIIKTCLYLLDYKSLDIKVENFKGKEVEKIKEEWPNIEKAMKITIELLEERGFNNDNITSYNAIMPIIYYIYKGGNYKDEKVKKEIFKYFIVAQLNQTFGGASNTTVKDVRDVLVNENKKLVKKKFCLNQFSKFESGQKNLKINKEDIDKWFRLKKRQYVYLILSLIKDGMDDGTPFHQDHMHADAILKNITEYKEYKDKLANIQLITASKNVRKSKEELKDWIESDSNHIPQDCPTDNRGNYI